MRNWFRKKTVEKPKPTQYAFWNTSEYPFVSGGVVEGFTKDGAKVMVSGHPHENFHIAVGETGQTILDAVRCLKTVNQHHMECARNSAGNAAVELLQTVGLPITPHMTAHLQHNGYQGRGYHDIFTKMLPEKFAKIMAALKDGERHHAD